MLRTIGIIIACCYLVTIVFLLNLSRFFSLMHLVGVGISLIYTGILIFSFCYGMYGIVLWAIGVVKGRSERVTQGKKTCIQAGLSFLLACGSYFILQMIISFFMPVITLSHGPL